MTAHPWVVVGENRFVCLRCHQTHHIAMPIAIPLFGKKARAFEDLHADCPEA